jgi:hypothetical protein
MNKDEILLKAHEENKGKDLADKSAPNDGRWIAYSVGVILIILVDTINGFVLHNVYRGADFAIFSMAFVIFLVKYIELRKKHGLIPLIIWGVL